MLNWHWYIRSVFYEWFNIREKLCLSFAKKCVQHEKLKHWFPINKARNIKTRNIEKFKVSRASTKRYKNSAIPYMKKLLNDEYSNKSTMLK